VVFVNDTDSDVRLVQCGQCDENVTGKEDGVSVEAGARSEEFSAISGATNSWAIVKGDDVLGCVRVSPDYDDEKIVKELSDTMDCSRT
jgi:hypothetical protein